MFVEIDKRFLAQGGGGLPFVVTTYGKKERDFADRKYGFKHHHLIWVTDGRGSVNINGEKLWNLWKWRVSLESAQEIQKK